MAGKRMPQDYAKYAAIQELVAKRTSVRQICKELNVDSRTVLKYFPNAGGHKGGGNGGLSEEKIKEIGQLVADGASLNEIMRTAHTDHRTIKRYFPNAGWKTRGGSGAALMKKASDLL